MSNIVTASETHPLSFGQQGLWFLQQVAPESVFYNIITAWKFCSRVDLYAFARAMRVLTERQHVLRTTYHMENDAPVQRIHPALENFALVDATAWQESEVMAFLQAESQSGFDLEKESALRVRILLRPKDEHVLMVVMHHIAMDGWSIGILLKELSLLYMAETQGHATGIAPLPVRYVDFVHWQRKLLAGATGDRLWEYWKKQLCGELPTLDLPTDRPRPQVQTHHHGGAYAFKLPDDLSGKLRSLSKELGTSLYTLLLSAFQVLLARYSGQDDIIVGSPTAARTRPEFSDLIGYFVDMIPLRANLAGDPAFDQFVLTMERLVLAALEHQDLPFPVLVERLNLRRDPSRSAIFQAVFVLQSFQQWSISRIADSPERGAVSPFGVPAPNETGSQLRVGDIVLEALPLEQHYARFDLELEMIEVDGSLSAWFQYNADLFDQSTIERMAEHFQNLLASVAANPAQRVSEIPLLSDSEQHRLLVEWNQTESSYPAETVQRAFASAVQLNPGAAAIVRADRALTYAELNLAANQLANYLIARGAKAGSLIGLCCERSPEMIIGLLGILKAGAAYVPLDPTQPRQRTRFVLDDTRCSIILTQERLESLIPSTDAVLVALDRDWSVIATSPGVEPEIESDPDSLACVMHTSGSSGRPNGVAIPHRGILRLVKCAGCIDFSSSDRVLQFAPLSFDASTFEIWGALLNGALLCQYPGAVVSLEELGGFMRSSGITIALLTSGLFHQMVDAQAEAFASLRKIFAGGDVVSAPHVRRLLNVRPQLAVVNAYGPTENSVITCCYPVAGLHEIGHSVPIGRPIANTTIYVLDRHMRPVPTGVVGELYTGGDGLARNYYERPDLTAERFVVNPFRANLDGRLYKTGDLVRYRANGLLEFHGRADNQIKIRGFRVEPGEIQSVLSDHPAVKDAVVIAREDTPNTGKQLAAYIVPDYPAAEQKYAEIQRENTEQWNALYEETYSTESAVEEETFNITGWNSSYTGEPIDPAEMLEQVEGTVERILQFHPARVLEIGCGTGLLLFRIADSCQRYVATDFSARAITKLREQVERRRWKQVELHQRSAHEMEDFEPASFDLILLNSIIQYFPGIRYLDDVLQRAVSLLAPGGVLMVGDVRNRALMQAFHASVQLYKAPSSLPIEELKQRIQSRVSSEEELLVHPDFFTAFRAREARLGYVSFQMRRGSCANELTRFRYDAFLHASPPEDGGFECEIDWAPCGMELTALAAQLEQERPASLHIQRIPNPRLRDEVAALRLLGGDDPPANAQALRKAIGDGPQQGAIEPEQLWNLAARLGYRVELPWSPAAGADGFYSALFCRSGLQMPIHPHSRAAEPSVKLEDFANNPLKGKLSKLLIHDIRAIAEERLPAYMRPAAYIALDALPLTNSGKIDYRKLPVAPNSFDRATVLTLPRNPIEEVVRQAWVDILGINEIGVFDNFFELGGHSLLATQIVSRVHHVFQIALPLRLVLEDPTIANMSDLIQQHEASPGRALKIARLHQKLSALPPDEIRALLQSKRKKEIALV